MCFHLRVKTNDLHSELVKGILSLAHKSDPLRDIFVRTRVREERKRQSKNPSNFRQLNRFIRPSAILCIEAALKKILKTSVADDSGCTPNVGGDSLRRAQGGSPKLGALLIGDADHSVDNLELAGHGRWTC